jgi:pimeloyl-ACP methyl ester carboxylesterase
MPIPVHDLGGAGAPLVISHATGFSGRVYEPLAALLAGSFRVFAVDHRGHGVAGSPTDGDMSYAAMAADLIEAIDACELDAPVVFGHSMGGTVALLAALERPGLFAGAYLYEPSALPPQNAVNGRMAMWSEAIRRRTSEFPSRAAALQNFATKDPYRRFRADVLDAFVEHAFEELPGGVVRLRCRPEDEAECYARNVTSVDDLTGIEIAATLACGADDEFGAGLVPPPLASLLPDAQLVVYEHLGHFGPFEAPDLIGLGVIDALAGSRDASRKA